MKLATFFDSKSNMIYLNSLIVYESKLKIKVTSHSLPTSAFFLKQIVSNEKEIANIFITRDDMSLTKTIIAKFCQKEKELR